MEQGEKIPPCRRRCRRAAAFFPKGKIFPQGILVETFADGNDLPVVQLDPVPHQIGHVRQVDEEAIVAPADEFRMELRVGIGAAIARRMTDAGLSRVRGLRR